MKKPRKTTPTVASTVVACLDRVAGYTDAMRAKHGDHFSLRSDDYVHGMADYFWAVDRESYYRLYADYLAAKAARK